VVIVAELQELSASELGAVVGDDGVRHSKPVDDVGDELYSLLRSKVGDQFGELIHDNQQVGVAPERLSQGPNDVQSPHDEQPCDGYGL
jgi:hypothetical protein